MPLTAQQRQGLHGEGFIFAMASAAGLLVSRPTLDVDGVDWLIGYPGTRGLTRSPKIEVQVKSCSSPVGDDTCWHYRMTVGQFNAIAGRGFAVRRYLVLVTVPTDPRQYAVCDAERMSLGYAAYWVSLAEQATLPAGSDDAKSVLVRVPHRNLLSPETLAALVAGDGEDGPG